MTAQWLPKKGGRKRLEGEETVEGEGFKIQCVSRRNKKGQRDRREWRKYKGGGGGCRQVGGQKGERS